MASGFQSPHVFLVARVREGAAQLDQEGLEADAELQGCLAIALAVQVGTGAQEQRLAGVEALASSQYGSKALLWAHLLVALAAARLRPKSGVDPPCFREESVRQLLAATEADSHRHCSGRRHRLRMRVGAGDRLGMQSAIEIVDALFQQAVNRLFVVAGGLEPAFGCGFISEGLEGTHGRDSGQRQLSGGVAGLRVARLAPAPAGRRRGAKRLDHEYALQVAVSKYVAAVSNREPAGKVELGESEEAGQRPNSDRDSVAGVGPGGAGLVGLAIRQRVARRM